MAMLQGIAKRRGRRARLATVDYTLAKRALLSEVRTGLTSWTDVCDAHPELMRAAKHVGEPSKRDCPVCRKDKLRLVTYVSVPRTVQRKISRRALFARDGWRCAYFGTSAGRLTLDHIVPRSRGGDSVWENVVTSCAPCNLRKGNRLLDEVPMVLHAMPRPPAPVLFIRLATPTIPTGWRPYLEHFSSSSSSTSTAAA